MRFLFVFILLALLSGCIGGQAKSGSTPQATNSTSTTMTALTTSTASTVASVPVKFVPPSVVEGPSGLTYSDEAMSFTCPNGYSLENGSSLETVPRIGSVSCSPQNDNSTGIIFTWVSLESNLSQKMKTLFEDQLPPFDGSTMMSSGPSIVNFQGQSALDEVRTIDFAGSTNKTGRYFEGLMFNCKGRFFYIFIAVPTEKMQAVQADFSSIKKSFTCG